MGFPVKPSGPQSGLPVPPAALGGTLKLLLVPPLSAESVLFLLLAQGLLQSHYR